MKRRDFLKYTSLCTVGGIFPQLFAQARQQNKILILIELKGGNDGLNTLVPFRDPIYKSFRPNLALQEGEVLPLSEQLALHGSLSFLREQFEKRKLAIFQSVGYQNPNLSHFRSIDIWETASPSDEFHSEGWVSKALNEMKVKESITKGVVLGDFNLGPLRGSSSDILVIDNPKKISKSGRLISTNSANVSNKALAHILNVENQLDSALQKIAARYDKKKLSIIRNGGGKFQRDLNILMQILAVDSNVPFFKLSLGGFDTHTNQKNTHANLLKQLDKGLRYLVKGLKDLALYNESLILTYSEFGRRPKENGNGGTDHGTANCQFALGGRVRGDLYGNGYDLNNLQADNLVATTDFKQVYQSVLSGWWQSNVKLVPVQKKLNFFS